MEDMSLREAWKEIQTVHPLVHPLEDNRQQLVDFEMRLSPDATAPTLSMDGFLFEQDDAEKLSKYCDHITFAPGEVIFKVGQHASEFYIVLAGQVEFYFANGDLDLILTPGNLFGYVDCQLGKARHQSAHASPNSDPVTVAAIRSTSLDRMSTTAPQLALKLMKVLLRQSSLELSNI